MLWSLTIDFRLCHSQNTDRMIIEEKFRSIVLVRFDASIGFEEVNVMKEISRDKVKKT